MDIQELRNKIEAANKAYWEENDPIISDQEYDSLINELTKLSPNDPLLEEFNGMKATKLVKHKKPMLSLNKAYSLDEILKWIKSTTDDKDVLLNVMPKYDGLSGKLFKNVLTSRGTGEYGQDYSDRLSIIEVVSDKDISKLTEPLLGEMLISNKNWNDNFKNSATKSGKPFKNQRNAAAGVIGCDDVEFYSKQGLKIEFVDYDRMKIQVKASELKDRWNELVETILKEDYPMDGIVLKIADPTLYEEAGYTAHHPKGAIAFKFTNQKKWSKLIGVNWSMGKEQLAAVGVVEPIDISGTTIQNVKLQVTKPKNSEVNSCIVDGSLQIGDEVLIERAGDIIPHVVESRCGSERTLIQIDECPFCGSKLLFEESSVKCTNENCKEKLAQGILYSFNVLGVKGIGEAYVRNLVDVLNVKDLLDVFELSRADLERHACFGKKMIDVFFNELKKVSTNCNEATWLAALNIDSLGIAVSKLLLNKWTLDEVVESRFSYGDLLSVNGIGEITAEEVLNGFEKHKERILKLKEYFTFKSNIKNNSGDLPGICFTGKLSKPRSEFEKITNESGKFKAVDHVDKKTKYLVCADPNSGSSKLQKAAKLGCNVISEDEFLKLMGKN